MTKLTLTEQEELFARDCKLINLRYEYDGYKGNEKWAIVSELSPEEIKEKYFLIIGRYTPFVYLSVAQGDVIEESIRNDDKYAKRSRRTIDCYAIDDELSSRIHNEFSVEFEDPFERAEQEQLEAEKESLRESEIKKVDKALSMLQPIQRDRIVKHLICGYSTRTIASQEGVYHNSVVKSIAAAKKNFIKFYENL